MLMSVQSKEELDSHLDQLIAAAEAERDEGINDDGNADSNDDNSAAGNGDSSNDNDGSADGTNDDGSNKDGEGDNSQSESSNANENDSDKGEQAGGNSKFDAIKVKVSGQEVSLDTPEEVKSYLDNQNNKVELPTENVVEETVKQAGLSQREIALMADVKAGKPGALAELAKLGNIDLADADEFEGEYETEFKPTIKTDFDRVVDSIKGDAELAPKFTDVTKDLPDEFLSAVSQDPRDLATFASHVKSGLAQELLEKAAKDTALGKGSLLENYIKHGEADKATSKESKKSEQSRKVDPEKQKMIDRAAADADANKSSDAGQLTVDDMWEDGMLEKVRSGEIDIRSL